MLDLIYHSDVVANLQNYLCNFCTLRCLSSILATAWGKEVQRFLALSVFVFLCMSVCCSVLFMSKLVDRGFNLFAFCGSAHAYYFGVTSKRNAQVFLSSYKTCVDKHYM